jgi:hypothetical protein
MISMSFLAYLKVSVVYENIHGITSGNKLTCKKLTILGKYIPKCQTESKGKSNEKIYIYIRKYPERFFH